MKANKILVLLTLIFLVACAKTQDYEIKNMTLKASVPLLSILNIANSNYEVRAFLQNTTYSVDVKEISEAEISAMPNIYAGLSGSLYMVYYSTSKFNLIVITNESEVLRIVPVQKVRIGK